MARLEVLELDQAVGPPVVDGVHERVDHAQVGVALEARLVQADVLRVRPQLLVVRADVEHARQHAAGLDAGARHVQVQLADAHADALDAEVAQAEHAGAVGDDDDVDVLGGPVVRDGGEVGDVVRGEVEAARPAEEL